MKTKSKTLLPSTGNKNSILYEINNIKTETIPNSLKNIQEYKTLLSNPITNQTSKGLKQMTLFNIKESADFLIENKNVSMFFSVNEFLGEQPLTNFTDTQAKVWDFLLTKIGFLLTKTEDNNNYLYFNLAELIEFLGHSFQTKTIRKVKNDLLQMGSIKVKYENHSRSTEYIGLLFTLGGVATTKSEIVLMLGPWFDAIKKQPEFHSYMFVNSKTFSASKTNIKSDPYYTVSRKIYEVFKNNLKRKIEIIKKKGTYEIIISAKTFIDSLLWTEVAIKKNTKKFSNSLLNILERIQKDQNLNYDIIDCETVGLNAYERFLNTKFVFYCEELERAYKEIGYK